MPRRKRSMAIRSMKEDKLIVNFTRLLNALMINDMEPFCEWYENWLRN